MKKSEFLSTLQSEHQLWTDRWAGIDLDAQLEPSLPGKMNLRDIMYHVMWYEREMIDVLKQHTLVGSDWWDLLLDERNAHILAEGQSFSLHSAYDQEQAVFNQLVELINSMREEELLESRFFREMPPEWKPWEMIASNTYEHYPQHLQDIPNRKLQ